MEVKVTDNSALYKKAKDEAVARALKAIGEVAEGYAADNCPVHTGRLWNSITHATAQYSGKGSYKDKNHNEYNDAIAKVKPEKEAVYIGSNVEYARAVETKDSYHKVGKAHFLRDAVAQHSDEYKQIAETQLRKG